MAITFYDVNSASGLKKLDAHLLTCSYITGCQASKDDITVHAALSKPPPTEFVNVSRWYNHIEALLRISGVSGEGSGVVVVGSAPITEEAIATPPAGDSKAAAADDDDDDDVDLFGEETEERAASIKASSKKKEFDRENEWITNELNTPLTPRSSSTAILDPAQDKNHDFNSRMSGIESATPYSSLWLAPNPSKRWGELFFLGYTPFWLTLCLGIIVPYKLYEDFAELEYLIVGLVSAVPSFLIPMLFSGKADSMLPWKERYWVKASLWIIIFSYVGNYFWTHYFFTVLGASYTFPSWRMNNVPHTTFLLTHTCFLFYHVSSNLTLRRLRHFIADKPDKVQWLVEAAWILALSYFIAYLETIAISNFPYYDFVDRASMYTVGSLFYAIYFLVSFPMFIRIDEKPGAPWDLPRVAVDALGAAMLVTIILDLWRIFLGPIVPIPNTNKQCIQPGLPWFPGHDTSA